MKMSRYIETCTILLLFDVTISLAEFWKICPRIEGFNFEEWYPVLEYGAQDKANLCPPPTQYEFYDFVAVQKYGIPNPKYGAQFKNACQVVIACSRPMNVRNAKGPETEKKTVDCSYQNGINHFGRNVFKIYTLAGNQWGLNRKQVSQVGCGYTSRLNKSHYIDHLECPWYVSFGLEQKALRYQEIRSPPSANCNRYQTKYPRRCVRRYKHLCFAGEDIKIKYNNSITSWKPLAPELRNFEKITPHSTEKYDSLPHRKFTADEVSEENGGEDEEWSLPVEIYVSNQFSYRNVEDLNCNLCKYVVIFAACSTGVALIMAAYVFYTIQCYQKEKNVTAWK